MKLSDHEQVVLKAIEHVAGSRNGLASVPAVTRAVSYPISTTQKILAALHRKEIIALHHHDYPAQMTTDEKKRAVKIGNDYFHAVAIRNPMKRGASKKNPSPAQLKARAAFAKMAKARARAARSKNPKYSVSVKPKFTDTLREDTTALTKGSAIRKVIKGKLKGPRSAYKIWVAKNPKAKKRATKRRNGIAKTAGKAIKKVARAVLGGVSKVAGKGAKALKNPRMKASVRQGHIWNAVTGLIRDGYTQAQSIRLMEQSGFPAKDIAHAKKIFATAKHEVEHGRNPARRKNLDHRDSSHQVKVHQHWRAGGLSQWQRAHHAGQHDLFSHGIKAKAKRNPALPKAGQEKTFTVDGKTARIKKSGNDFVLTYAGSPGRSRWGNRKEILRDVAHLRKWKQLPRSSEAANPSASAIRKKFAGRVSGSRDLYFPKGAPQGMAKLGRLVSIKLKGGKLIKPSRRNPSAEIWLCSDTSGKLWLGCTKAGPLYAGAPGDLGEMSMLEYSESKPHIGYPAQTIWFHKMGEVSGRRPHLIVNDDQDLLIKGGNYKITRAGIVD